MNRIPVIFSLKEGMSRPSKERVREVIQEVDALDLLDGVHWALIQKKLGLSYGEVFDYIAEDPAFFGATPVPPGPQT